MAGCTSIGEMVLSITIPDDDPRTATGQVVHPGAGSRLGFRKGDVVMQLQANDFGKWPGKIKWRSIRGDKRWDPVTFVLQDNTSLKGTMVFEECWKSLVRLR